MCVFFPVCAHSYYLTMIYSDTCNIMCQTSVSVCSSADLSRGSEPQRIECQVSESGRFV